MKPLADAPPAAATMAAAPARDAAVGLRAAFWLVVATHALIDVFPMFVIALMIVLNERLAFTPLQETLAWIALPIFSGGCQPLFAWLGDRFDTRLAGPLGLATGAACLSSIGFATTFWQFLALEIVGVVGVGMYHPAAIAVAGQVGSRALVRGRGLAISLFVTAGMVGHTLGPLIATRVNAGPGMAYLALIIPFALLLAGLLYVVIRRASHRPHDHHERHRASSPTESSRRWVTVALLSGQNSIRFLVNTALYIVFSYWAAARIAEADEAALLHGKLTAATTIGMGIGALSAGWCIRAGRERGAFALSAFAAAVCVAAMAVAGDLGPWPMYAAAVLAAIGFFATIPASVGLAQRLVPAHTGLASALLLGVGWVIGALARPLTAMLLGVGSLEDAPQITAGAFDATFVTLAGLLVVAGLLAIWMPRGAVAAAADHD